MRLVELTSTPFGKVLVNPGQVAQDYGGRTVPCSVEVQEQPDEVRQALEDAMA